MNGSSRALVLAGGGVAGIAWETGVLLGLRDAGVDLATTADLVVGTSAGSVVGAQICTGADLAELQARQLDPDHREIHAVLDLDRFAALYAELGTGLPLTAEGLRRLGAFALATATVPEPTRRAVIEWRLPVHEWPERALFITAVDAATGEVHVFDRHAGVSLVDAVTASCAVPGIWPPVTIGERRFIDGGVASMAHARLAAGAGAVVVVAPLPGPGLDAVTPELDGLRAAGARVVVIAGDDDAAAVMAVNPLDPAVRGPAAEHGRRQGRAAAAAVGAVWSTLPAS